MNKRRVLTIERHPFSTCENPRWIVVVHDEIDGNVINRHHVSESPTDLRGCAIFKLQLEMPNEKKGDHSAKNEVDVEIMHTLHAIAEEKMKTSGPIGDAWLYIYEKTGDDTKSMAWVATQVLRAVNDPKVASIRKIVYREVVNSLG